MKHSLLIVLIMFFGFSLSAQIRPRPKPMTPSKETKGELLDKPYTADIALSKCERYMRYHKQMWRVLLNSNPTTANPLELTKEISRLRILPAQNATGHILVDKAPGAVPFPKINNLNPLPGYNPFPVPVSGTTVFYQGNNAITTFDLHWETGNYGTIKEVMDIYKVGTQNFIDVVNSSGVNHTIKIFPGYFMDGCQIPVR